ncbi:hypothetical protein QSH57_011485 [Fusarium oxysporum f. sp. vasinfectum]|nr:hypothetical protein QSH57_011485 [Fusarium oxysporum f. sp. vasinfectum]
MGSLDDLLVIPAVPESEPDSCRNCRSRDLQCEYGTDSDTEHNFGSVKGRRQMKQKERSGALMTPFTDGNNANDDPGNLQSSSMSEAVVQDLEVMQSELHHTNQIGLNSCLDLHKTYCQLLRTLEISVMTHRSIRLSAWTKS